jgi:hypothetical protein
MLQDKKNKKTIIFLTLVLDILYINIYTYTYTKIYLNKLERNR